MRVSSAELESCSSEECSTPPTREFFVQIPLSNLTNNLTNAEIDFLKPFFQEIIKEEIQIYEQFKIDRQRKYLNERIYKTDNTISSQSFKVSETAIKEIGKLKKYKREKLADSIVEIVRIQKNGN